jgi:hypothetical protein
MSYTGYNQEDSILINKGSIDRGLFLATIYHTEKDDDKNIIRDEIIRCPPDAKDTKCMKFGNYGKLNSHGFIPENTIVENRDILIAKKVPIKENRNDLCASIQKSIVTILIQKLELAVQQTGFYQVALAGGVSANSELRKVLNEKKMDNWKVFIPKFEYCTDNAAMIAIAGKFLFDSDDFATQAVSAKARMDW